MTEMWRNGWRQIRSYWLGSLFIILGSALGTAALVVTLGTDMVARLRRTEVEPPDAASTVSIRLVGPGVPVERLYQLLSDLPDLAAAAMDQPFNAGPRVGEGLATSVLLRGPVWWPPLLMGRPLTAADCREDSEPVVVIGRVLAESWFTDANPIGRKVALMPGGPDRLFTVVGVMGVSGRLTAWDRQIVLPAPTDTGRRVTSVVLKATSPHSATALAAAASARLRLALPDRELRFEPVVVRVDPTERRSLEALVVLGMLVAVVAGVNCGNLAASWALRRRREMAIRQALGATKGHVIGMVIWELVLLNLLGAVIGVALYLVWRHRLPPATREFSVFHVLVAVAGAMLTGTLAGTIPAVHVARVDPAEGVRTE